MFREGGPGDAPLEADPSCGLSLFLVVDSSTTSPGSASSPGALLSARVDCGPHKLLAVAEEGTGGGGEPPGLLLALTDDVDAAIVAAVLPGSGTAAQASAGGALVGGTSVVPGHLSLTHAAYLPALAYVVAGKTQRRHLLLGV
jgi:hypothetical protein